MHLPAGVPASVYRMPRSGLGVVVGARPSRCRVAILYHGRSTARIRSCWRCEGRASRTLNCGIAALAADLRWRRVAHQDALTNLRAGVTASIHRMPPPGRDVFVPTHPSHRGITVVHYCGTAARVRSCRRGEGRCGRTLNNVACALSANLRRSGVYYRDGLAACSRMVPAAIGGIPGTGLGVSASARTGRASVAHQVHCGTIARITGCWRCEGRASRTLNCGIAARSADLRRSGVYYRNGLAPRSRMVAAAISRIPRTGLGVSARARTGRASVADQVHCRTIARITGCWRGKGR
jgi:hypothetical protein